MVEKKKPSHKESQNPKAKSQKPKAEQKQKSRTNAEQNRTKAEQKQNKSRKKQNKSRTKQSKSSTVFTINFIIDPSERHQYASELQCGRRRKQSPGWVSIEWDWLIYYGAVSVQGSIGWYSMVLGQWKVVLVGTWWYWVSMERYWLIHDGTGSVEGGTGWYLIVLGQ